MDVNTPHTTEPNEERKYGRLVDIKDHNHETFRAVPWFRSRRYQSNDYSPCQVRLYNDGGNGNASGATSGADGMLSNTVPLRARKVDS